MATFGALIGTAGQAMLETEEFQTHQDTKRAKVMEVLQSEYNGSMPSETTALREKYTTEFKLIWLDKVRDSELGYISLSWELCYLHTYSSDLQNSDTNLTLEAFSGHCWQERFSSFYLAPNSSGWV